MNKRFRTLCLMMFLVLSIVISGQAFAKDYDLNQYTDAQLAALLEQKLSEVDANLAAVRSINTSIGSINSNISTVKSSLASIQQSLATMATKSEVQGFDSRISSVEASVRNIQPVNLQPINAKIATIEASLKNFGDVQVASGRLTDIETSMDTLQANLSEVSEDVIDLDGDLGSLTGKIAALETTTQAQTEKIVALESGVLPSDFELPDNVVAVTDSGEVNLYDRFFPIGKKKEGCSVNSGAKIDRLVFFREAGQRENIRLHLSDNGDGNNVIWVYNKHLKKLKKYLEREQIPFDEKDFFIRWYSHSE